MTKLGTQLKPLVRISGGVVGLRADEGQLRRVVRVMDVIKKAGGERLALGTQTGERIAMPISLICSPPVLSPFSVRFGTRP